MTLNHVQSQLLENLVQTLQRQYPAMTYEGWRVSPDSNNDIWLEVTVPDDDTMIALGEMAGMEESKILVEKGYKFTVMPRIPVG